MTLEQQEEYYEKEYNYFKEDTREYPDDLIFNLKTSCEDWKKYWSQEVEREEDETDEDFQAMLELQKERIEFWDKALKSINTEIVWREIRNSNK